MAKQILIFAFALGLLTPVDALADDCDFDQENQNKWLKDFAAQRKGARVNEARREVVFPDESLGEVTLSRGGCAHFGTSVSVALLKLERMTNREAVALGTDLFRKFVSEHVAKEFAQHISDYTFEMSDEDKTLRLTIYRDPFGEMSLTYESDRSEPRLTVMEGQ